MGSPNFHRPDALRPRCWAPFSSMHLDPRGLVRACCQNHWSPLGHIGEASLLEIWHGAATAELRRRLLDGDLTLGCELCASEIDLGVDHAAYLHVFDDLPAESSVPAWPRQLELALSISCNLQCVMCNGELSSSIRIHREGRPAPPTVYDDRFFEDLDRFLPHLERVTFLGGEPLLGAESLRVMDRLVELGLRPACHLNTNGTQWGPRVERILRSLPFHVAVSVDGRSREVLERTRVGVDHAELVDHIDAIRRLCAEVGNGFSLSFCLMPTTYHELVEVLAWGDELDCDVFINTVTNPPAHSLHHAPAAEVLAVLGRMEEQERGPAQRLLRNRTRWIEALDHVRSLSRNRARDGDRRSDAVDAAEVARRCAEEAAEGGAVVTMEVDDRLLITAIGPDPADAFGLDVRSLVGAPSISFLQTVWPTIGEVTSTSLDFNSGGVERRRFTFSTPTGHRQLLAAMARNPDGEIWFLALGPTRGDAQPVTLRPRAGRDLAEPAP